MRSRAAVFALTEALVVLLGLAAALVQWPDATAHPERFTARVTGCDLSRTGSAQVSVAVRNGDRSPHGYRVELLVSNGSASIGAGVSLVGRVAPGTTATTRALLPVRGDSSGAVCRAKAAVFDGVSHHA